MEEVMDSHDVSTVAEGLALMWHLKSEDKLSHVNEDSVLSLLDDLQKQCTHTGMRFNVCNHCGIGKKRTDFLEYRFLMIPGRTVLSIVSAD